MLEQIYKTLSLLNSMVISGEVHSNYSALETKTAFENIRKLEEKQQFKVEFANPEDLEKKLNELYKKGYQVEDLIYNKSLPKPFVIILSKQS